MDRLQQIAGLAESTLKPWADQVGTIDPGILVIILLLIVIVALASRSLLIFLESFLLALVGFLILLLPNYATTLIGIGAGLSSLLITFVGIRSRAIESRKYDKLSRVVRELELAEERRFLRSLNSQSRQVGRAEERSTIAPTDGASEAAAQLAAGGLRVLAVAIGTGTEEVNLTLLGLIGIADPPRTEAAFPDEQSVSELCNRFGGPIRLDDQPGIVGNDYSGTELIKSPHCNR